MAGTVGTHHPRRHRLQPPPPPLAMHRHQLLLLLLLLLLWGLGGRCRQQAFGGAETGAVEPRGPGPAWAVARGTPGEAAHHPPPAPRWPRAAGTAAAALAACWGPLVALLAPTTGDLLVPAAVAVGWRRHLTPTTAVRMARRCLHLRRHPQVRRRHGGGRALVPTASDRAAAAHHGSRGWEWTPWRRAPGVRGRRHRPGSSQPSRARSQWAAQAARVPPWQRPLALRWGPRQSTPGGFPGHGPVAAPAPERPACVGSQPHPAGPATAARSLLRGRPCL